ncbi:MAG: acyl-CoA thioesterase [Bacteroidota bacterium]
MKSKTVSETFTVMTELVLPNESNNLGNLMGGQLMYWMDVVSAISAQRATHRTVVTVAVDFVEFKASIPKGAVVILEAKVTRCFNTSLEVKIDVFYEILSTGEKKPSNSAYFTFVAVDQGGRPIPVTEVLPETAAEKELYEGALRRRELRMLLAGRIKPEDARGLQELLQGAGKKTKPEAD